MSTLHSCHWDWCRFTTVLHDDFVRHVISAHIDTAEPVKRGDISLIRHVEEGASVHDSEPLITPPIASIFIIFFLGGVLSIEAPTSSQFEAPQSISQSVEPSVSLGYSSCLSFFIVSIVPRQLFWFPLNQQTLKWSTGHYHSPLALPASSHSLHKGDRQVALKGFCLRYVFGYTEFLIFPLHMASTHFRGKAKIFHNLNLNYKLRRRTDPRLSISIANVARYVG
jgi:hypothetical protein